jgi:hypothetical protein
MPGPDLDVFGQPGARLARMLPELFVSLTGITYDEPGWWRDLRYRVLWTWRDRQQGLRQRS